ncbi:MAG: class I SAM-dependent methyltransferase [Thaumarchaeota archaeon]|nr:class I SAM-dependent methyltransferase [Nitrososphaerota archaeon]
MFGEGMDQPLRVMRQTEGWLSEAEAIALYEVSSNLPAPVVAVEIGSWHGKSSVMVAGGIRKSGGGTLYALDPFVGAEGHAASRMPTKSAASYLETFLKNVESAGVKKFVCPVQGFSYDIVKAWKEPIDFIFIDGEHEYDDVKGDFDQWSPHIKPGGFVGFHDAYGNWPGPTRVVEEELRPPLWRIVRRADSLVVAQKLQQGGEVGQGNSEATTALSAQTPIQKP